MKYVIFSEKPYWQWQRYAGVLLFLLGLTIDCFIGSLLLYHMTLSLCLFHIGAVLIWVSGLILLGQGKEVRQVALPSGVQKWSIAALLMGLCFFPGLGPLAYSLALVVTTLLRQKVRLVSFTTSIKIPALPTIKSPETRQHQLMEALYSTDLEVRRTTLAVLGRQVNAQSARILRQLLVDPQAEIRSDASILLARLEEQLSQELHVAQAQWEVAPTKEHTRDLIQEYYQYAASNVLDEASQHFYYVRARALLLPLLEEYDREAENWLLLATICQCLGEMREALHAALLTLDLQPGLAAAHTLAKELAFQLHDWVTLDQLKSVEQTLSLPIVSSSSHTELASTSGQLVGGSTRG